MSLAQQQTKEAFTTDTGFWVAPGKQPVFEAAGVKIYLASSIHELERIYRFRYEIYVREMNRNIKDVDHATSKVQDSLDDWAYNLYAVQDRQIVGAARINFSDDGEFPYSDLYQTKKFEKHFRGIISLGTKVMVSAEKRGSKVFSCLLKGMYTLVTQKGSRATVLDCNAPLDRIYEKVGFRKYLESYNHPEYGNVMGMIIDHFDRDHFVQVNSPLLPLLDQWRAKQQAVSIMNPARIKQMFQVSMSGA